MTEKAIRLAVLLVSGGVSSAASVGALLHTNRLTEQALTGHRAAPIQARSTSAPTLTLKNGAQLDGQILATSDKWLKIRVPDLGDLTIPREQIAALNSQEIPAFSNQNRAQQTPPIDFSSHYYRGKKKPQLSDYERAEREAQRALEEAARKGEKARVKELKAIIRQSRQAQGEAYEQKKASEANLAKEKERQRKQAWEANKWQTRWGDAPPDGAFTPIPRVSSRPGSGKSGSSSASTSASSKNWMNWVTGDDRKIDLSDPRDYELYKKRHEEVCSQGGRIKSPDGTAAIVISCP